MRLGFYRLHLKADLPPPGASRFSLAPDHGFSAGGHGGAAIPVPIPNTEVKGSFAEGSAGPARARVGRRRLFFVFSTIAMEYGIVQSFFAIRLDFVVYGMSNYDIIQGI